MKEVTKKNIEEQGECPICGSEEYFSRGSCKNCSFIDIEETEKAYKKSTNKIEKGVIGKIFLGIFGGKKEIQKNYCECGNEIGKKNVMCRECLYKYTIHGEI